MSGQGSHDNLRIILLGKTGAGMSSSGNTILGKKAFEENAGFESGTRTCEKLYGEVVGRLITVIDVPGLCDTRKRGDELKEEIEKCVTLSVPGPHAFLLVIRLDVRFTEEEQNTVKWIQDNFGVRALKFTIVLFTRVDQLKGMHLEDAIKKPEIQEIINKCGGGYHAFNNDQKDDQTQVNQLLEKIDTMVEKNGGECFTNEMYEEAQRKIREEEERKRQEEERKRKEYEEKIREMIKRKEEERQREERNKQKERKRKEHEEKIKKEKAKKRMVAIVFGGTAGGAIVVGVWRAVVGTAPALKLVLIGVVGGAVLMLTNMEESRSK